VNRAISPACMRGSTISRPALLITATVGSTTDSAPVAINRPPQIQHLRAAARHTRPQPSARDARCRDDCGAESFSVTRPVSCARITR
jgi:hypothetical protein